MKILATRYTPAWTLLAAGVGLLAAIIVTVNITGELGASWAWSAMMLGMALSILLIITGLIGVASARIKGSGDANR